MSWYYAIDNERRGPVEDTEMAELVTRGIVRDDTFVWREGMADWERYGAVMGNQASVSAPAPGIGLSPVQEDSAPADGHRCRECGGAFPPEEMLQFQGEWICAACKPLYFARLREGAPIAGQYRYAGFWIRFCAKFVDGLIMIAMFLPLYFLFFFSANDTGQPPSAGLSVFVSVMQYLLPIVYTVFFLGRYGATPGKMACGLRVIRSNGDSITYMRAFGRYFAEILNMFTVYIGYIMAGLDSRQHRALHDYVCDTRVVYK